MASGVDEIYQRTVRKNFKRRANWKPGKPLKLGDYGELKGRYYFSILGNITEDLGIDFEVMEDRKKTDIEQFCSKGGFQIVQRAKGDVTPGGFRFAKAGISISFSRSEAVFIDSRGYRYDRIKNIPALSKEIVKEYRKGNGKWEMHYLLVTEVERAESATIVITTAKNASIDIEAAVAGPIQIISDPSLGLKAVNWTDIGYKIVASKGVKIMMETRVLRWRRLPGKLRRRLALELKLA